MRRSIVHDTYIFLYNNNVIINYNDKNTIRIYLAFAFKSTEVVEQGDIRRNNNNNIFMSLSHSPIRITPVNIQVYRHYIFHFTLKLFIIYYYAGWDEEKPSINQYNIYTFLLLGTYMMIAIIIIIIIVIVSIYTTFISISSRIW